MRFTPTLFQPRDYAEAPVGDLTGPDRGEAGADGEAWLKEAIGGGPDINHELSGSARFDAYDEMRKTDAVVKATLMLPKLTVRSAMWGLEPASDDPVDRLIRDMVAENIGLDGHDGWMDLSWAKQLEQLMLMLDFGCSFEEIVWGDARQWVDADGDQHLVRPVVRLAARPPRTVHKVEWAADGTIRFLRQNLSGVRPIPGDKLCYSVFERDPGRWEGVSMLRAAWGPWRLKKLLVVVSGVGWDRWSLGIPAVWHPDTPDGEETAKAIGRNLRSHQRAYVHFPVPQGGTKDDSEWAIDVLHGAASIADPTALLKWCDDQIATVGLQQYARQGLGQTGARATAETQAEGFYLAVEALAEDIRFERSRQLIRRLVEVNFGLDAAEKRLPKLTVSRIQSRNLTVTANAIGVLAAAGLTFTEPGDVNNIRELLGLEVLPDDVAEALDSLPDDLGVKVNRPEGSGLALSEHDVLERLPPQPTPEVHAHVHFAEGAFPPAQPPNVHIDAPIDVHVPALADRELQEPPVVNITNVVEPTPVTISAPPAAVSVTVPRQKPPTVTVNVPDQPAPNVTVENRIEQPPRKVTVARNPDGTIKRLDVEDTR